MHIVVISPTYNELDNVGTLVPILEREFALIPEHTMSVLFVDDNSPDGTAELIRKLQKKYSWIKLLSREKKQGLGRAYAAGMKYAVETLQADAFIEFDADMQHNPEDLKRLVAAFDEGNDYVIASRYVSGGSIPDDWGMDRKFLSVVGNLVARVLLLSPRIHDVTTGFKLTRVKGFYDKLSLDNLISPHFAYKVQLLHETVQAGAKVKEVPIHFLSRTQGESKLIKNEMLETLRVIWVLQSHNPKIQQFVKFGAVGFLGFIFNSIALELFNPTQLVQNLADGSAPVASIPGLSIMTVPSSWAAGLAAEVAVISNFILNNLWTFRSRMVTNPFILLGKFLQFNLTSVGAIIIQFAVIGLAVYEFGDTALVRQLALMFSIGALIIPYNYFMYTKFIWKK